MSYRIWVGTGADVLRPSTSGRRPSATTMASEPNPPRGGMSLYANLLNPSTDTPGTISRAPVVFKQSETEHQSDDATAAAVAAAKKQQLNPASLRFQPPKRPQLSAQKPKPKHNLPKAAPQLQPSANQTSIPTKSTLADWTAMEDDDYEYTREKRQRGGRKKRKKNFETHAVQNWDDVYDSSRPTSNAEYRHGDEKISEVREWKDRLYAHVRKRSPSRFSDSEDYDRPKKRMFSSSANGDDIQTKMVPPGQFAPPSNFAPPPNLNDVPPPASTPNDPSGEDAFARRAALGQRFDSDSIAAQAQLPTTLQPRTQDPNHVPDNPPLGEVIPPPPPTRPLDTFQPSSATISRAPVRYTLPPPPEDIPASNAELEAVLDQEQPVEEEEEPDESAPRSLRPGQQGFAERLLSKYGWTRGSGLGATGSGMVNPLHVKIEKRKKRPDSEGGGFVTPAGRGKIIGTNKKSEYETSKFGPMSEVVILRGMLDGMDLDAEMEGSNDGGLMQEIGEECHEKYGNVERVFIARDVGTPVPVFVKFRDPLSGLRAVNALEGRIFNGNKIAARFFDTEKFDQGIYAD
ncbi:Nucleotide-binding alpha-beta plait [Penicillium cf. griseofulvum]|uniref:Nucleotide-binding alpha-beta plait n=1 Tax=Penicillium cf. griseofulvum TaxID=2972120 RepID=A0A9W9JDB6_9EURO|nr:Nucleotide-binding alpha-beta plait [Penicillium cf. griseofulvum]KAJ5445160.1 Nucleotide-binding alpha-beta plait [Penicillium cf. griseofulvum]KAJ5446881.1 Nucleotide-binding alpha-beta plait [Penicillium cf. griseofulvum]